MILVLDHNPEWAKSFEREASKIRTALGATLVNIHHIGSTSITHTKAKPVIDILLEVSSLDELDQQSASLQALNYEAKGEFGIPGRRYYRLDDASGIRTHQVHAFEAGVHNVIRHLAFRDYMRAHPDIAAEYGDLKQRFARENPHDMAAYIDGKDFFVKEHDLYPWLACVYVESSHRGKRLSELMFEHAKTEAATAGYKEVFLTTDHDNFYEKFGWARMEDGYGPDGQVSKIVRIIVSLS